MKILLAADGSESTRKVAEFLAARPELARGGKVVVFNAQEEMGERARGAIGLERARRMRDEAGAAAVEPTAAFLRSRGVEFEVARAVGDPGTAIAAEAKARGCDLILMGARGHGFAGRSTMGSVAQRVLHDSDIPVLLVK